jgi:multidrug transporter EmrE-like cation transporter
MKDKKSINWKAFLALQCIQFIVSFGGICSKMAGRQLFLSKKFFFYYGLLLCILFVYAIVWQQILKKVSLMVAYASKGVGIIYSILWGVTIFGEKITWNMIVGAILVLIGVYCYIIEEVKEMEQ